MKHGRSQVPDEATLAAEARRAAAAFGGRLPTPEALAAVARGRDIDFATRVLHEAVLACPGQAEFLRTFAALPAVPAAGGLHGDVLLVPGLAWEDHPELGADGRLVLDVARTQGFRAERIATHGRGSASGNAQRVAEAIGACGGRDIWLVSLSRGSADLRLALAVHGARLPWERLRGWVNVCGFPHGSELVRAKLASPVRRLVTRVQCLASRMPLAAVAELSADHPHWRLPLALPSSFEVVNVCGFPLRRHLDASLARRHRLLAAGGPNDGLQPTLRSLVLPGRILPLWGCDHYFRRPEVVPALHRLFGYLAQRTPRTAAAAA